VNEEIRELVLDAKARVQSCDSAAAATLLDGIVAVMEVAETSRLPRTAQVLAETIIKAHRMMWMSSPEGVAR
jgi:predicted ATP-grasp superfamily ATP-dependent carboligase